MTEIGDAVTEGEEGWNFVCSRCGFSSTGWATKKEASDRARQHLAEHDGTQDQGDK